MTPTPTPAQAVRVLEILEAWTKRGFFYKCRTVAAGIRVEYQDPNPRHQDLATPHCIGANHFEVPVGAQVVEWRLAKHEVVDHGHLVSAIEQCWNEDAPDVASPPGTKYPHQCTVCPRDEHSWHSAGTK